MRKRILSLWPVLAFASLAVQSEIALALPVANAKQIAAKKLAPSPELLANAEVDFTAIIALSNCSGSLVRFTTSKPEDKAMVLTNGHCLEGGFLDAGEVRVDVNSNRSFALLNSAGSASLTTLKAAKILYATMTGTDVTLYSVTKTYAEIKDAYGVDALTIAEEHPEAGVAIRIPSGFWRTIYSCEVEDFIFNLKEADWTFTDSLRYSEPGCDTIGGTSGSPIINADTKEIIGINNTGNEDGEKCTLNNPCEVTEDGEVAVRKGASYGQQLYQIYSCLTEDNKIDLNKEGCQLAK